MTEREVAQSESRDESRRYEAERSFFDQVAEAAVVTPMERSTLDRYARPRRPDLFGKEKMFSLLPEGTGLRLLEIGCGEGVASVQLAYRGLDVVGIDLSPNAIAVAKQRALVNGVKVDFRVGNIEQDELAANEFDVVWCDLILHHVVPSLPIVMQRIEKTLRPGGLFIAREPVAYAGWLKALRGLVPVKVPATPDEQPFRQSEFSVVRHVFPELNLQYFRVLARLDRVLTNLSVIAVLARLDRAILAMPGTTSLAGNAVFWARKTR